MSDVMGAGGGLELQGGSDLRALLRGQIYLDLYNADSG